MYRQSFKATFSLGERISAALRQRTQQINTRPAIRQFSNTSRLSSREEGI